MTLFNSTKFKTTSVVVAAILLLGIGLRVPDVNQGLLGDEQIWIERALDFADQLNSQGDVTRSTMYHLDENRFVRANGDTFPFNLNIKSHHPGYSTTIFFTGAIALLGGTRHQLELSSLIQIRLVQSLFLIGIALAGFFFLRWNGAELWSAIVWPTFILTEPFILGESRTIKQDVIFGSLILAAMMATALAVHPRISSRSRAGRIWAMVAGGCLGLAIAAKLVGIVFAAITLGYLLFATDSDPRRKALNAAASLCALVIVFFAFAPNLWSHLPWNGAVAVVHAAIESPQAAAPRPGIFGNVYWTLHLLVHFSLLFPILFFVAVGGALLKRDLTKWLWLLFATGAFSIMFLSAVKDARYAIPFVMIVSFAAVCVLTSVRSASKKVAIGSIAVIAVVHGWNFVTLYPYHMIYTWDFLERRMDPQLDRLTATILVPDVAEFLKHEGIQSITAITASTLHYYYSGHVKNTYGAQDPGWALVSQKYFSRISPACSTVKSFAFRGYEVYRLVFVDGVTCRVGS